MFVEIMQFVDLFKVVKDSYNFYRFKGVHTREDKLLEANYKYTRYKFITNCNILN